MSSFREHLAGHLNDRGRVYRWFSPEAAPTGPILENDIKDIDVRWSDLEVEVTTKDGRRVLADPGWCIENLMRLACGLEVNP